MYIYIWLVIQSNLIINFPLLLMLTWTCEMLAPGPFDFQRRFFWLSLCRQAEKVVRSQTAIIGTIFFELYASCSNHFGKMR